MEEQKFSTHGNFQNQMKWNSLNSVPPVDLAFDQGWLILL